MTNIVRYCPNCKHTDQHVWSEPCGSCKRISKRDKNMTNFEPKEAEQ